MASSGNSFVHETEGQLILNGSYNINFTMDLVCKDVLAQTDAYVGELLSTIDELGLKDDTIFIFTSDNGREGVPRSFGFTGPWRAGMFSPYEGSLRVPFLIRWPGQIPAKSVSNEIFHQIDLFPTIANL